MNGFLIGAAALVASLMLPFLLIGRGGLIAALIALELVGVTVAAALLLFAAGDADSALALLLTALAGTLVVLVPLAVTGSHITTTTPGRSSGRRLSVLTSCAAEAAWPARGPWRSGR